MNQAQTTQRRFQRPSGTPEDYVGYAVLDPVGQKIGRVEKLFLNGGGGAEFVRVRIGLLFSRQVLIPVQDVALDRAARSLTLK